MALGLVVVAMVLRGGPAPDPVAAPPAAPTVAIPAEDPPTPAPTPAATPTAGARNPVAAPEPEPTVVPDPARGDVARVMPPVENRRKPPTRKARTPDPEPSTDHFIVVDGESGAVLFQRNAFEPVAPASLTKIMTALVAIEQGSMHETVKVDVDAAGFPDSAVMGLRVNAEVSMLDLLYGLMLASGNDAAVAIARHMAGSVSSFARRMNYKATWLRLGGTQFANAHGFDEEDHYSCPADMVSLARYAMQYPLFRQVVASRSYEVRGPYDSYHLENVNALLSAYPGVDGVKTGHTPMAGRSLVGTAVRDGHRVYVAFMRSAGGAVADGALLLDWAFESHDW